MTADDLLVFLNSPGGALYGPFVLAMIVGWALDARRGINSARFRLWAYIILPLSMAAMSPFILAWSEGLAGRNIDRLLAGWDDELFGGPAFAWGRLIYGHEWRMIAVSAWYNSLGTATAIGIASARRPVIPFVTYVVMGAIAAPLYYLFPAIGPAQAFEHFPALPVVWAAIPAGVCNGFPSFHIGGAVVGLLCAPRRWAPVWTIYSAGIVFCCVATGQHWLVDCVAGTVLAGALVTTASLAMVGRPIGPVLAQETP